MKDVAARNPGSTFIENAAPVNVVKNVQTDLSKDIFAGLQNQMEIIGKEQDSLKKDVALGAFKASVAETSARLSKETRVLAEQQAGLPQLEEALKRAEQLDRADPLWNQHLVILRRLCLFVIKL